MIHLSTHYGETNTRRAEIFRLDDDTHVVYLYENESEKHRVYYDNVDDAEDRAEEFVVL